MHEKTMSKLDLTTILRNLVQKPTVNPPGKTDHIIKYLISEVFKEEEGFHNEIIPYKKKDVELKNLISTIGSGEKKIILSGHLDVVPAGDHKKWKYPPFSAEIVDGKLYGRGSSDMKAGLTMLIGTMLNLKEEFQLLEEYTFVFLGSADEEAGMTGAYTCFRKGIMKNAILLIVGEPTNMNIGIAEKGLLWIHLEIQGKSAHSSTPNLGINSIEGALKLIPLLYSCLDEKENKVLGKSTLNIGKIEGGNAINIVPDKTILTADYRLIPEQDLGKLIRNLKNIQISPCTLETKVSHTLPALQADLNHPFIQNLWKYNKPKIIGFPYATDAAVFIQPKKPVPFVIFGPGDPSNIHKIDEFVELEQVFQATEYLTNALLQTYSKEND